MAYVTLTSEQINSIYRFCEGKAAPLLSYEDLCAWFKDFHGNRLAPARTLDDSWYGRNVVSDYRVDFTNEEEAVEFKQRWL